MRIAVVTVEGVLSETSDLMSSPPTKLGKDLFDGLKAAYRVVLISNGSDLELSKYWLKKEGFKGWAMVLSYPLNTPLEVNGWKVSAVREMMGDGWDVGVVIDTSVFIQQAMLSEGVATMLVSYPTMSERPGRLPEHPGPLRPWDEIANDVETKNLLEQGGRS